jgi:hypothetical protein
MKHRTHQIILTALIAAILITLDLLIFSIWWQHEAVIHHAGHFETTSWGVTSFHWNDESAQTPFADPVNDALTPPPLKK